MQNQTKPSSNNSLSKMILLSAIIMIGIAMISYQYGLTVGRGQVLEEYKAHIQLADMTMKEPPAASQIRAIEINRKYDSMGAMLHMMTASAECVEGMQSGCDHMCNVHKSHGFCEVKNARSFDFVEAAHAYGAELDSRTCDPDHIGIELLKKIGAGLKEQPEGHPHSSPPNQAGPDIGAG